MRDKYCPKCKNDAKQEDVYCRICGVKLKAQKKAPKRECGHRFKGKICPECGRLFF